MIPEKDIDQIINALQEKDFDEELLLFKTENPLLHAYLLNDQYDLLTEDEYAVFWFGAMVIVKSFKAQGFSMTLSDPKILEDIESGNWALLENAKPQAFSQKINIFFENTKQEDLLAFVEDSLVDDDEMPISSASREIIFISLLSIIDLFEVLAQDQKGQ